VFELMTEIEPLPLEEGDITQIHEGMSSLRVSVGEHVSQPSEVFVVTGLKDGLLLTFIIFYMIEPGVHVVYRFEENPYDPERQGEVLGGAFQFVEEMGGILQEVPWGDMSPEDRANWIADMNLFPGIPVEEEDLLENLEEIQLGEIIEVLEEEDSEETPEFEVEVEDEGSVAPPYTGQSAGESPEGEEFEGQPAGEDTAVEEDEDEDFDQLLKQAFLKPELIRKTSVGKRRHPEKEPADSTSPPEPEEVPDFQESPGPGEEEVEAVEDLESGVSVEVEAEGSIPEAAPQEEPEFPEGLEEKFLEEEIIQPAAPEESGNMKVVRFLSRF